jgi:hypothetical protein
MKAIPIFFLLLSGLTTLAQNFSERTNEIRLDLPNTQINTSLPVIRWITPQLPYTNSQRNDLVVEGEVTSDIVLKEIHFSVSDSENNAREKKIEIEANAHSKAFKQTLSLPDGQHVLKITVVNIKGGQVSSSRTVLVGKDAIADAVSIDRKDYAILFATDKYDHWSDLVNPVEDAQAIAEELKSRYGFEVEVVENPTQEDVFIKISEYVQRKFKPQDQLLIFFAGHGYFDDTFGEGFVVAKNSLEDDKAKTSYISHSRLRSVINNIPCEHIFLTMDVCFGGTFDPVIAKERGESLYKEATQSEFLVRKLSYKTRKYLTSGGKTYVSDGVAGKHSPFALKLLQALKDSGGNDRILTIEEIRSYVEKLVPEPRSGSFGDDNPASDFVFVSKGG